MGFGLPVIGVDAGGMPDLIGEKNGFLVKPHDHRAIAKSIEKVLSDSSLRSRLSRASKKSVDVHSVKHVTAALLKEYKVLLKIRR
jgi:glycosyltransferase involved in cell wall biosynthesis